MLEAAGANVPRTCAAIGRREHRNDAGVNVIIELYGIRQGSRPSTDAGMERSRGAGGPEQPEYELAGDDSVVPARGWQRRAGWPRSSMPGSSNENRRRTDAYSRDLMTGYPSRLPHRRNNRNVVPAGTGQPNRRRVRPYRRPPEARLAKGLGVHQRQFDKIEALRPTRLAFPTCRRTSFQSCAGLTVVRSISARLAKFCR
jgi:hypothetical protein